MADEEKTELEIDFRIQGFPQFAVEHEDERTRGIRRSLHLVKNHPNKGALTEVQKTCAYNPFREESEKVIHNLGNVDYLQLCEISSKTLCFYCSKDWAEGIVYLRDLFDTSSVHGTIDQREIRHIFHSVVCFFLKDRAMVLVVGQLMRSAMQRRDTARSFNDFKIEIYASNLNKLLGGPKTLADIWTR